MTISFQHHHAAMLLKYSGISFISGAVNHGFFSGTRSLWTAAIGIALFVLGAWLEHRLSDTSITDEADDEKPMSLAKTLFWGSLLSIGLGFFTGGLQHFPDSPARSAWVVPLGFWVSVVALAASASLTWKRSTTVYAIALGAVVAVSSFGAYRWLEANPQWADGGHAHGAAPTGLVVQTVSRSIDIHMDDQMRFTPSQVDVKAGEVIRFVVHNGGAVAHEFVLGNPKEIAEHADLMRQMAAQAANGNTSAAVAHQHGTGAALSVAPKHTGELVVSFPTDVSSLEIACLIPGHYEAGMRGSVKIAMQSDPHAGHVAPAAPASQAEHKH